VSKSRRKPVPRARTTQPDRRDQAAARQSGPPKRVAQLSGAELLEQIRQVRIERDNAVAELAMLIDAAVSQDLGWPQIASQLGVTRQAARQQYQRRHPGGASH
jgi:predicted methyltransferase